MYREEVYGAVIHSLAVSKRGADARNIFESMSDGDYEDGVLPGTACYDAVLLSFLQEGDWEQALELHGKMKASGISQTPATFQGALIASHKIGELEKAVHAINEALSSEVQLDQSCCELAMRILLRTLFHHKSISETRLKLREICEEDRAVHPSCLDLLRSLRVAEVEEKRLPNNALTAAMVAQRRQKAWRDTLFSLVQFARIVEEQESTLTPPSCST